MAEEEFERIVAALNAAGAAFTQSDHPAVRTSAEAAAMRGSSLSQGVKALVVKFKRKNTPSNEFFAVIALPADCRLDFNKAKAVLKADEIKLASEAETVQQTGCQPGGVPPFCHRNKLALLADPTLFRQEELDFNAGLPTRSIRLAAEGLKKAFDAYGVAYFDLKQDSEGETPKKKRHI